LRCVWSLISFLLSSQGLLIGKRCQQVIAWVLSMLTGGYASILGDTPLAWLNRSRIRLISSKISTRLSSSGSPSFACLMTHLSTQVFADGDSITPHASPLQVFHSRGNFLLSLVHHRVSFAETSASCAKDKIVILCERNIVGVCSPQA